MGRTACTEPQCLYKGALYLYLTVELYLYSPYGPYGLYSASVPVQGGTLPFVLYYWNCLRNATWYKPFGRYVDSNLLTTIRLLNTR